MKKSKNTNFNWDNAENEFVRTRLVSLPVKAFKLALKQPVFDVNDKTRLLLENMINEQLRTLYHSVWMMLDRMSHVEKVQGISPKFMNEEDCLKEILPVVRSGNAFKEGFRLYDSGNYCGVYSGDCESGSDGKDDGFEEYGRIPDFMKDLEEIDNQILDRGRVFKAIRCVYERNLTILKYRINKHIILQEIKDI